jgi:hypothetical protein
VTRPSRPCENRRTSNSIHQQVVVKSLRLILLAAAVALPCFADDAPQPPADVLRRGPPIRFFDQATDVKPNGAGSQMLDFQRRNVRTQQQMYESIPASQLLAHADDLVKFSLLDGVLRAEVGLSELPRGQVRVRVEDSPATWVVRAQPIGMLNNSFVSVVRLDFDQTGEGQVWTTTLTRGEGYLQLTAAGIGFSFSYHQSNGMVMLTAMQMVNGRLKQVMRSDAPNLLRLQAEHPDEVHRIVLPMLQRFGGERVLRPGAADVYAVFAELPTPSDVQAKVAELLPRLDSQLFPERDAATRELAALGRPGIQALLKVDRSPLTFEQNDRLDALIGSERRRTSDDLAALRADASFLIDCLEDEDPAVRTAAKSALYKALNRAVDFDPSADAPARAAAAERLRQSLRKE